MTVVVAIDRDKELDALRRSIVLSGHLNEDAARDHCSRVAQLLEGMGHRPERTYGSRFAYSTDCWCHEDLRASASVSVYQSRDGRWSIGLRCFREPRCEWKALLGGLGLRWSDRSLAQETEAFARELRRDRILKANAMLTDDDHAFERLLTPIGLDREDAGALLLGVDRRDDDRLLVPCRDGDGSLSGSVSLLPPHLRTGKPAGTLSVQANGPRRPAYDPLALEGADVALVVEGPRDLLSLRAHGRDAVLALPSASIAPSATWTAPLEGVGAVYLLPDADAGGRELMTTFGLMAAKLHGTEVFVVELFGDDSKRDVSDLLDTDGVGALDRAIVERAVPLRRRTGRPSKGVQAETFLRALLADGPVASSDIYAAGADGHRGDGLPTFGERTLRDAADRIGADPYPEGGRWYRKLPETGDGMTVPSHVEFLPSCRLRANPWSDRETR